MNGFYELTYNEMYAIDGGSWVGTSLLAIGVTCCVAAVMVVAAPVTVTVGLAACGAFYLGEVAIAVGLAEVCGADL